MVRQGKGTRLAYKYLVQWLGYSVSQQDVRPPRAELKHGTAQAAGDAAASNRLHSTEHHSIPDC
jgi:hypothetical protein